MSGGRAQEWLAGRLARGRIVFTGARRRLTSMTVRGDQMAEEMGGICLRHRYLTDRVVASSPALIWVVEADLKQVAAFEPLAPQILDVVNPATEGDHARLWPHYRAFKNLILTTESSQHYLGNPPAEDRRFWVIPHHHCNPSGWTLPPERIERPRVFGYLGQPEHLHDAAAIRDRVEKLGFEFRMIGTTDLGGYRDIDIGIAWTRREAQRDLTRSNIKLTNFAAHGIPSVVCDYESYRDVERQIGDAARICGTLTEFLEAIGELSSDLELRRRLAARAPAAQERYSRTRIAQMYWTAVAQAGR